MRRFLHKVSSILGRDRSAAEPIPESSEVQELTESSHCVSRDLHLQSLSQSPAQIVVCEGRFQPQEVPSSPLPEAPPLQLSTPSEYEYCERTSQINSHTGCKKPPDGYYGFSSDDGIYKYTLATPLPPPYSPKELLTDTSSRFALKGVTLSDQSLGAGSYGSVVLASYRSTPVAAKSMHSVLQQSAYYSWQHEKEIETLSEIRHPNIVQFLGTHSDEQGSLFLIMEHVEGGSVSDLVVFLQAGQKKVSLSQKMNIFIGIGRALEYLHSIPLVHRDLSSSNVLLTKELQVKVSDFGMCRAFTNQPSTLAPGCYLYMPPEALRRDGVFTEKGDIFSLSVIIMELINQAHPRVLNIEGSEYTKRMRDVQHFNSKSPPEALRGLVEQCLHDNPTKRPHARDINRELEEILTFVLKEEGTFTVQSSREPHQEETGSCQVPSRFVFSSEEPIANPSAVPHCERESWEGGNERQDMKNIMSLESFVLGQPSVLETSQAGVEKSEMVSGTFSKCFESTWTTHDCDAAKAAQEESLRPTPGSTQGKSDLLDDEQSKPDMLGDDQSTQGKSNLLGGNQSTQGKSEMLGDDQSTQCRCDSLDEQAQIHTINLSDESRKTSPSTFLQQLAIAYGHLPQRCGKTQGSSTKSTAEGICVSDRYPRKPQQISHTEIVPKCSSNLVLQNASELNPDLCTSRSLLHSRNYCCPYYAIHIILGRFQIPCGYIDVIVVLQGNTILLFAIRITLMRLISLLQSSQQGTSQQMIASATNAVALPHTHNNTAVCHGSCLFCTSASSRHRTTVCLFPSLQILTNGGHCMYTVLLSRFRLLFGYLDTVVILKGSTTVLIAVRVIVIGLINRVKTYQPKMLKHDTSLWIVCAAKPAQIPSSLIPIYSAVYACIFRMLSHMLCSAVSHRALPTPSPALSSSSCEIPAVESSTNTSPHSSCNDLSFSCGRSSTFAIMVLPKRNIMVTNSIKRVRLISIIEFPLQLKAIMQSTSQDYQGTLFPSSESQGTATSFPALTTPKIRQCIVPATTQVPSTYNQRHICIAVYAFVFRMFSRALHCSSKLQQKTITIPNSLLALPSASISAVESSVVIASCSSLHSYNCRGVTGNHCTCTIFFGRFKLPCGYLDVLIMLQGSVVVKSIIVFTLAPQLMALVHGRVGNTLPTTGKGSLMCAQTPPMCSTVWQTQGTFNIPLCTVEPLPTSLTQLSVCAHIAPLSNTVRWMLGTFLKYAMVPPSNHVAILPASSPPMQAMEPSPMALEMTTHVKNLCTGEILPTSPTQLRQNSWSASSASCFLSTKHPMKVEQNSMATVLASPRFQWDDLCGLFLHQSMFLDLHSRSVLVTPTTTSLSPTGSHNRVWVGRNPSSSAPVPPKATVSQRLLPAFPFTVTQRNLPNEQTDSLMEQVTPSQSTTIHLNNTPRTKEESCVNSLLKYGGKCVEMGVLPNSQDTICAIAVLSPTIRQFIYTIILRLKVPLLHNQPMQCGDRDSALQVVRFKRHLIEVCRTTSPPTKTYKTNNISPSSLLSLIQDISKIDLGRYPLPRLQGIFPCHATDDVTGSTVRHLLPMKCVDTASPLPAVCLTPHSVGMCSATLTQAYTLSKTHISPSKSLVCKSPTHNPPKHEFGKYLLLLNKEVHNYLGPEVLKIFIRIFELFPLALVVWYKTREAVMHQQHPDTVSRRNTEVAQMLEHGFHPSCHRFWFTMRLGEGCFTCAWNCHEALTMWSAKSSSPHPASCSIHIITLKRFSQPSNTVNSDPEDLKMTYYCPHTPALPWVHQSHYHPQRFNVKICNGLPSKQFQLGNGKDPYTSYGSKSVPTSIVPGFPMCLLDCRAGVACKSAGIAPNHQNHMTSSDNPFISKLSSPTREFHPLLSSSLQLPQALLNQQPRSLCSQTCLGDRESNAAKEVVQGSKMKKDRGDHEHAGYQRERGGSSSAGKITQSKRQERCPTKKPSRRKKRRKKSSLYCEKTYSSSTICWCTLRDHSQLLTSHIKRRYVAVSFFGRNWTRKKEYPFRVSLCSSPWRVKKMQETMLHLLALNPLPSPDVQSDTLPPAACTPNLRRWICNQVLDQKAYMLFLHAVALHLPCGLVEVYMHNNKGACGLPLLLAARENSPLTHTIISLLPPPGVGRPRPARLPLDLNQPVRVVSSPQSGGSTTTTGGGSGSGRTAREESGGGPNETPGDGAGHTSPGGGGKRGGDERDDDDRNGRGRIHNESDDKEEEMEEEGNQEEESGEEGTERESGEYSEEGCLPMCCSSDRDETHRTGGTIVTPSDSSKSHKVKDKTKKGKDSDTVPPQPPPKSDQVQNQKETSHTHVDAEEQTHEELPEHEVSVQPDPSKTSHTEHERERETSPEVDELLTEEETGDEVDSNELETSGTSVNNEPSTGQENTIHPFVEFTGEPNSSSLVQEHHTHPTSQKVAGFLHSARSNQESPDNEPVFQHKSSCTIEGQPSECNETSIRLQIPATTLVDYSQLDYVATNDDINLSEVHSFVTNPVLESTEHSISAFVASDHLFQLHLNLPPARIPLFPLLRIKREGNSSSSSEESQDDEPNDETLEEVIKEEEGDTPSTPSEESQDDKPNDEMLEEAIEEEGDTPATPTMAIHSLPPVVTHNNTAATICIPTPEEIEKLTTHESRELGKEPYKNMPSQEEPEIPGADVTEDFELVQPIEESPFLPRLYEELRQNGVQLFFSGDGVPQVQGAPLEQYLEQALQNGNLLFAVKVLHRLINTIQICSLWGTPFSLNADEVYVDIQTQELMLNATACIAAHMQSCYRDCMQTSVCKLKVMLQRLLFILQDNNLKTNHQVIVGVHLLGRIIEKLSLFKLDDILAKLNKYM